LIRIAIIVLVIFTVLLSGCGKVSNTNANNASADTTNLTAAAQGTAAVTPDEGYVATMNGYKIPVGEYKYFLEVQKQTMIASAQSTDPNFNEETYWASKIGDISALDFAKQKAFEAIKSEKIEYEKAKEANVSMTADEIIGVDDGIQTNIIDAIDTGNTSGAGMENKANADKVFTAQYGFSLDVLRSMQLEYYTVQKYQSSELSNMKDEDANIDTYYTKNPEWFKGDTQFRRGAEEAVWARHILITVAETATQAEKDAAKNKAGDIIVKLKAGADFATLAQENSEDPGSKDRGGDYVFGKGQMDPAFEAAAFALSPGQITETPLQTSFGYHIIKLEEKFVKDQPVSLNCVKNYYEFGTSYIKYKIYMSKLAELEKAPKYNITINRSVYDTVK
jgi:parvulin-like peptidyl-prolyl isomerase